MVTELVMKRNLTAMEQYLDFKRNLPDWYAQSTPSGFTAKAVIQPTPLSDCYTVRVSYRHNTSPIITVLNNKLKPRVPKGNIKHTYRDGSLCLFYPKAKEWTEKDLISQTIVPWISVWLYYYEIWFVTGQWLGGGIEH
ncbi:MAG: hypothetical protein V4594_20170 [Bacteroidota bacterium]